MKSSYPLGSCPNLGLKINVRHYDSFRRVLTLVLIGSLKFPNNFMLFHY